MSIRLKLTALAVLLTLITAGVVGVASYRILERALIDSAFERLAMLRENQRRALQVELQVVERSLSAIAHAPGVAKLVRDLRMAQAAPSRGDRKLGDLVRLRDGAQAVLPASAPATADAAAPREPDGLISAADRLLRQPIDDLGFEDIYIVLPDGWVAYSARRRSDFATSVTANPDLRDSGLLHAFARATKVRRITVTPPEPYLPAESKLMLFVALPIEHGDALQGVLIGRVSQRRISRLLDVTAGLGGSGETYLVGADLVTRGSSRTFDSPMVIRHRVDTPMARAAVAGRTGQAIARDYRGATALSAYGPFEYRTFSLGLLAEISKAEILAPLRQVAIDVLALVAGVAVVLGSAGLAMASGLARPLVRLSAAVQSFGKTRKLADLPYTRRRDEIGAIARVVAEAGSEIATFLERQEATRRQIVRSEAQFKAVVDQLPSAIMLKDLEGGYLFVNDKALTWLGAGDMFELLGATTQEVFDAETAALIVASDQAALAGAPLREQEITLTWPDGRERVCLISKFPIHSETGDVLALGTVATDISVIRAAEGEIRRAESDLRLALTYLPGGLYKTGPDDRVQLFNDNWKRLLDYPDELAQIGVPREKLRQFRLARGDVVKWRGDEVSLEDPEYLHATVEEPDGMLATEELVGERILEVIRTKTPDGGIVGVVRDTTKRRRAEAALAKSEERFRAIVDQLPDAIVLKDSRGRYELINEAYRQWYGLPDREAAVGTTAAAFVPPETYRVVAEMERHIAEHRSVVRRELSVRLADAQDHSIISSQFPLLSPDGTMFGMGTVLTDITEQKRAEQRLANALSQVRESVDYAGRIQRALLPDDEVLDLMLGDHFVIWQPKDGVGGDMFWVREDHRGTTICLFDCTGHGVPGALMTTIAIAALNNAYDDNPDPAALIAGVNRRIKDALGQIGEDGDSDDGLEMGACWLPPAADWLVYAGARFPLIVMHDDVDIVQGDRSGVGYRRVPYTQTFTNHKVTYGGSTAIYLFTDGVTDQIGGDKRRAFGRKRVLDILRNSRDRPMSEQRGALLAALEAYQGSQPRRDDISMIGIRLSS